MKCESLLFHPCPVILSDIYFFCSSGFSSEIDEDYEKTRRNIVTKYDRVSFMHNINVYIIIYFKLIEFFFLNRWMTLYTVGFFFSFLRLFSPCISVSIIFFSALSGCSFSWPVNFLTAFGFAVKVTASVRQNFYSVFITTFMLFCLFIIVMEYFVLLILNSLGIWWKCRNRRLGRCKLLCLQSDWQIRFSPVS